MVRPPNDGVHLEAPQAQSPYAQRNGAKIARFTRRPLCVRTKHRNLRFLGAEAWLTSPPSCGRRLSSTGAGQILATTSGGKLVASFESVTGLHTFSTEASIHCESQSK